MESPGSILERINEHLQLEDVHSDRLYKLIDACMNASLCTEEGIPVTFSLLWSPHGLPASKSLQPVFTFRRPVPITRLAKVAHASKTGQSFLIVRDSDSGDPAITGMTKARVGILNLLDPALKDSGPMIAISCLGPLHLLFQDLSDELVYIRHGQISPRDYFHFVEIYNILMYSSGEDLEEAQRRCSLMTDILRGMWLPGRGGTLAICAHGENPADRRGFSDDGGHELEMPINPMETETRRASAAKDYAHYLAHKSRIGDIVRLSAVDGALLLSRDDFAVLGFGFKFNSGVEEIECQLQRRNEEPQTDLDLKSQGTRHKSAANWVNKQAGRVAIVVSQDKKVSVFGCNKDKLTRFRYRPLLFREPTHPSWQEG